MGGGGFGVPVKGSIKGYRLGSGFKGGGGGEGLQISDLSAAL